MNKIIKILFFSILLSTVYGDENYYFAKLDSNKIVETVIVVAKKDLKNLDFPESEVEGKLFIANTLKLSGEWMQTNFNSLEGKEKEQGKPNYRKNYAGPGHKYDQQLDSFIPPKTFDSFVLDVEKGVYVPPVEKPKDGKVYVWNEETKKWDEDKDPLKDKSKP